MTMPATPTLPPSLRKYSTAAAHVVGDVQRLQVIAGHHDDFLAHVAGNGQAKAAADHVAQKVEQHVVKTPVVETEFFERFKTVDDAATAAAATDLGATEFHGEHAIALEAHVANAHGLAGEFFRDEVSMMVGQALPPNSKLVVSLLGSQPISSTFLPCCAIM